MLSKLSPEDLDTLTRALEPLERLATCDAVETRSAEDTDCAADCP